MRPRLPHFIAFLLLLAATGCSSSSMPDPRGLPTLAVSGIWTSTAAVGQLGTLRLALAQREQTRVYDAALSFPDNAGLGTSDGFGTLAEAHMTLDFDSGAANEYFFEGTVALNGNAPTTITGQLVFPDQDETLPVTFNYTSALPPGP